MNDKTDHAESSLFVTLRLLKSLRDMGVEVTLDDLFSVMERGDRRLTAEELGERVEALALRRRAQRKTAAQ